MNLKYSEKIRNLFNLSKSLKTFWEKYSNRTSETRCDKYGAGFNTDDRFKIFKGEVFFEAHSGEYGCSSTYSFDRGLSQDAWPYFIKALNKHKEVIFQTMSEEVLKEAKAGMSKVKNEIDAAKSLFDSLEKEGADEKPS